ncbi:MAG: Channel protein, hemolysin III family [Parcubacteria group bacterium GW2011_GWC2_49_9]|nr:MAG: Channel protein, hemolysin III family [Parcubacteria group bacterium GW2011_GWC2_49_9]
MPKPFSLPVFLARTAIIYGLLLAGMYYLLPGVWEQQVRAGWMAKLVSFVVASIVNAFFVWPFHRWLLHGVPFRCLRWLANDHRGHHAVTEIKLRPSDDGVGRVILNEYPIVEKHQHAHSAFPCYALPVFWVVFSPAILLGLWIFSTSPLLLTWLSAIALSLIGYETFHAAYHFPYEWWEPKVNHRYFGWFWRPVYGFHMFHHANIRANEGVFDPFGLFFLVDWLMKTLVIPKKLLLHNRVATAEEFKAPKPWGFISWIDRWVEKREREIMRNDTPAPPVAHPIPQGVS